MGGVYTPTDSDMTRLQKAINKMAKKTKPLYNKLIKRGHDPAIAQMISHYPPPDQVLAYDFKNRESFERTIKAIERQGTARYRVYEKEKLVKSIVTILIDRLGVDPAKENELYEYFNSMTLDQWYAWINENWDFLDDMLKSYHAGMLGFGIYDESESKYILQKFTRGRVKW